MVRLPSPKNAQTILITNNLSKCPPKLDAMHWANIRNAESTGKANNDLIKRRTKIKKREDASNRFGYFFFVSSTFKWFHYEVTQWRQWQQIRLDYATIECELLFAVVWSNNISGKNISGLSRNIVEPSNRHSRDNGILPIAMERDVRTIRDVEASHGTMYRNR